MDSRGRRTKNDFAHGCRVFEDGVESTSSIGGVTRDCSTAFVDLVPAQPHGSGRMMTGLRSTTNEIYRDSWNRPGVSVMASRLYKKPCPRPPLGNSPPRS